MDDENLRLFFAPRQIIVQARLDFLSVPPSRIVAFPCEAKQFTGTVLHWIGGASTLCRGEPDCIHCKHGTIKRDYFYAPAYLWCFGTKTYKRFVLPIGNDLTDFFEQSLTGSAWKVHSKENEKGRKKGLRLERQKCSEEAQEELATLASFDIRERLLQRYKMS